jgi:GNAT superfamily N-acetyltransferase
MAQNRQRGNIHYATRSRCEATIHSLHRVWAAHASKRVPGITIMVRSEMPAIIRSYEVADYTEVVDLFIRVNRELAPPEMLERFEQYIRKSIDEEMSRLHDIFSETRRNAFWVVEKDDQIIGMFGIESRSDDSTELRRMYLDRRHRGRGIAQRMLQCAETRARELGFAKLILSTAEVQKAAIAFYRRSGYRLVRSERADTMSTKTVGGGLARFHFEKAL